MCCFLRSFCGPLLGPQLDWCVWFLSPLPSSGVTLGWCWPLLGLLARCQACSTTLDGLPPRVYLRWQVSRRKQGQGLWFSKVCVGLLWEGICNCLGKLSRLGWHFHRRTGGQGNYSARWTVGAVLVPADVHVFRFVAEEANGMQ